MTRNVASAMIIALALQACATSGERQGTLAELESVPADVDEIYVADSLERAAESYRRYLAETPKSARTPEAMRRLADTYPMLNKDKLLHEAAGLMSQHVMQGREAEPVIDELQILFERHYRVHLGEDD